MEVGKKCTPSLYGELGEHIYQDLYSYYMVGADSVYLIDTDVEPTVNVLSC